MGDGWSRPRPGRFNPGKRQPVSIVQEARWAPGLVCMSAETLPPTRIRSPDCPALIESLYRTSYSGRMRRNEVLRGGGTCSRATSSTTNLPAGPPQWQSGDYQASSSSELHVFLKIQFILFQMKPTRCTLLLSIFISTSLHVSCNYVPIISRTCCIYATLVFFTVWVAPDQTTTHTVWKIPVSHRYSNFSWWWAHSCPKRSKPDSQPYRETNTNCHIDTVSSPDDWHIVARNMYRSSNKYTK